MRIDLAALAALSILSATAASAQCPARFDGAAPAAWGAPTATDDDNRLYEPRGLRMLGRGVAYVVVERDSDDWKVHYRLAGEVRRSGEALSQRIRDAFARTHPEVSCSDLKASCTSWGTRGRSEGDLDDAELMDDNPPGYQWTGSGARLIAADEKMEDRPAYLICSYTRE